MSQRRTDAGSVCVGGQPVDIYWRFCTAHDLDGHIEEIAQVGVALIEEISSGNPFTLAAVKGQITALLKRAAQGNVRPRHDLRVLRSGRPVPNLFELRWPQINYEERRTDPSKPPARRVTGLRLIHVEPTDRVGRIMVGLLMHVKAPTAEAKADQDEQIEDAIRLHDRCANQDWGVQLRG